MPRTCRRWPAAANYCCRTASVRKPSRPWSKAHQLAPQEDSIRATLVDALFGEPARGLCLARTLRSANRTAAGPSPINASNTSDSWRPAGRKSGQIDKAFAAYLDLARLRQAALENSGAPQQELEQVERSWKVRLDRWLPARIGELLETADSQQRAVLERTVREQFDAALQSGDSDALQRFLASFGAHPLADQVRLRLAAALVDAGELLEAELLLGRLEAAGDETLRPAATAELARLLERGRQDRTRRRVLPAVGRPLERHGLPRRANRQAVIRRRPKRIACCRRRCRTRRPGPTAGSRSARPPIKPSGCPISAACTPAACSSAARRRPRGLRGRTTSNATRWSSVTAGDRPWRRPDWGRIASIRRTSA